MTPPLDWKQQAIAGHERAMQVDRPPAEQSLQRFWRREVAFVLDAIEFAGGWVADDGFIRDLPCASHDMAFRGAGYRIAMVTIWWPHKGADRLAGWLNAVHGADWSPLAEAGFLRLAKLPEWDQEAARQFIIDIMAGTQPAEGGAS